MELLYLFIGLIIGGIIGYLLFKNKGGDSSLFQNENALLKVQLEKIDNEKRSFQLKLDVLNQTLKEKEIELTRIQTELSGFKKHDEVLNEEIGKIHAQYTDQFKLIAGEILKENSKEFSTSSNKMLEPLREKLKDFEETVRKKIQEDTKTSEFLKYELNTLKSLNQQISEEAHNLTKALKGEVKTQGNWGELILEKIMERSGLVKDTEYKTQVSLNNVEGDKIQPDVIVYLPDEKHIIIDAKVSLTAYEAYVSENDESKKLLALKEHINSVKSHIKKLSEKQYQTAKEIQAPDFVLMFLPIESSFSIAIKEDVDIFNFAWDKNIVIVSPSTLLATLRTVASLWKQEKQSRNVIQIADEAGKLYDKFVGFLDDFKAVGNSISKTQQNYDNAFSKLSSGNGNVIGKIEKLKELGAKSSKQIDKNLLE
ncbi:MAG: DNA recombination protein RmuC [Bacteroidetes bacterium]|nr:DNA recombination protein RmuC [Bacteroidota bacterium]